MVFYSANNQEDPLSLYESTSKVISNPQNFRSCVADSWYALKLFQENDSYPYLYVL